MRALRHFAIVLGVAASASAFAQCTQDSYNPIAVAQCDSSSVGCPHTIDILVVHSMQVDAGDAEGLALLAEQWMNTALGNSDAALDVCVRIVGVRGIGLSEGGETGPQYGCRLEAGRLDWAHEAHLLRDEFAADVVVLLTTDSTPSDCGRGSRAAGYLAGIPAGDPNNGFAWVPTEPSLSLCSDFSLRFAHEVGHVMGLGHWNGTDPAGSCHGFLVPGSLVEPCGFATIMVSANEAGAALATHRIQQYSNPWLDVDVDGSGPCPTQPTGDASHDATACIRDLGPVTSWLRCDTDCNHNGVADSEESSTCAAAAIAPPYRVTDLVDLATVLSSYGVCDTDLIAYTPCTDLNRDGCIDNADIAIVAANFGMPCP